MTGFDLSRAVLAHRPFPHARVPSVVDDEVADAILAMLEDASCWSLRVEDFYEQHEFSLCGRPKGDPLGSLASPLVLEALVRDVGRLFGEPLEFVDASVHRLTSGQTIRIHNDHIGEEESHRLLVQINNGWTPEWGGHLMLFGSDDPADLSDVVSPESGSGFAFEISPRSHHAVSTSHSGRRYTLVYTFRRT